MAADINRAMNKVKILMKTKPTMAFVSFYDVFTNFGAEHDERK